MTASTSASSSPRPTVVVPIVAGIGNALMAVPMVRQIKRLIPGSSVHVIARIDAMAEPFRRLGDVDGVAVSGNGVRGMMRMLRQLRRHRADICLIPFPSNRWQYSLLAGASGARRVIIHSYPVGYWRAMHFLVGNRPPAVRGLHDVEQNLRLLRELGVEPDVTEPPRFVVREDDRARATALLQRAGVDADAPFIAIHAGSARTLLARAKRWPAVNYARLIEMIRQQADLTLLLIEGPDEAGVADEILGQMNLDGSPPPPTLRLTGGLGDAAAVLERARLYVGSDSGLAHLAAAVGTRAVTLFAPADPDRVSPFGNRDLVIQPPCDCCPCFDYPWKAPYPKMHCREPMCIDRIDPPTVLAMVERALHAQAKALTRSKAAQSEAAGGIH